MENDPRIELPIILSTNENIGKIGILIRHRYEKSGKVVPKNDNFKRSWIPYFGSSILFRRSL